MVGEWCFGHEQGGGEPIGFAFLMGAWCFIVTVRWDGGFVVENVQVEVPEVVG